MGEGQEITLGEIGRAVERLEASFATYQSNTRIRFHELADSINAVIGPISAHSIHISTQQAEMARISLLVATIVDKVNGLQTRSAFIAGAIGLAAFVAQFLSNWLKGH